MSRRKKPILEVRSRHAILRCSDVEWERFGRAAGKLSFSEWARKALLSECELFEAEQREREGK